MLSFLLVIPLLGLGSTQTRTNLDISTFDDSTIIVGPMFSISTPGIEGKFFAKTSKKFTDGSRLLSVPKGTANDALRDFSASGQYKWVRPNPKLHIDTVEQPINFEQIPDYFASGRAVVGTNFGTLTIKVRDAGGQIVPNYTGTIHFSTTSPNQNNLRPDDYTFTATDQGVHIFTQAAGQQTRFYDCGLQDLTVTDISTGLSSTNTYNFFDCPSDRLTANDPYFVSGNQDGLYNNIFAGRLDHDAPEAWKVTIGSNDVVIADIDTGIDFSHEDLAANMWSNPGVMNCPVGTHGINVVDKENGNYSCTNTGPGNWTTGWHGTATAGVIGAVGNNGIGIAGVAWNVSLMSVRVFGDTGSGTAADVINGLEWIIAAKQAGINVRAANISLSWGSTDIPTFDNDAALAGSLGIVLTISAGNSHINHDITQQFPCSIGLQTTICVAAMSHFGAFNSPNFSDYGHDVDLIAMGQQVQSTCPANTYCNSTGTSLAAPFVAGAVALLATVHPELTAIQMKARIDDGTLKFPQYLGCTPYPTTRDCVLTGGRLLLDGALNSTANVPPDVPKPNPIPTPSPTQPPICPAGHNSLTIPVLTGKAPGHGAVTLTWKAIPGATSYCAWSSGILGAEEPFYQTYTNLITVKLCCYAKGTLFYFKLTAVNASGQSNLSNEVKIIVK